MGEQMVQPNVLVVLSDQQRPDSCGVFGQRFRVTPRPDRLAADGVAFEEAFTVQPVCGPSRTALQTGSWGQDTSPPSDMQGGDIATQSEFARTP